MAYADAETGTRKLTAGAAVVALELGLFWALINGLSYTRTFIDEIHTGGFPLPSPTPTKTPPPPTDKPTPQGPIVVPSPVITLGPSNPTPTPTDIPSTPAGGETGSGPGPTATPTPAPTPTPTPKPLYQPKAAKPKGDTSGWLTTDDYPTRSIRERQEGRTGYRLAIDSIGRVTGCAITSPSGYTELDTRACQLLPKRARFDPARDTNGAAVNGSYTGNIQWRLPPEE